MIDRDVEHIAHKPSLNLGLATLTAGGLALVFGACLLTILDVSRPLASGANVSQASLAIYQLRHPL
jgi:hypothetical protein